MGVRNRSESSGVTRDSCSLWFFWFVNRCKLLFLAQIGVWLPGLLATPYQDINLSINYVYYHNFCELTAQAELSAGIIKFCRIKLRILVIVDNECIDKVSPAERPVFAVCVPTVRTRSVCAVTQVMPTFGQKTFICSDSDIAFEVTVTQIIVLQIKWTFLVLVEKLTESQA